MTAPGSSAWLPRTRRAFALGLGLALLVLAATLTAGAFFVRSLVRQQIADRDAEGLYATTLLQQLDLEQAARDQDLLSDEEIGFDAAILASRLKGVIGIRFFDPTGGFTDAFPATIQPGPLPDDARRAVLRLEAHSRFQPRTLLTDIFIYLPQFATNPLAHTPTLEVTVPLHRHNAPGLTGAAQFIVEGQSIVEEYARLDRHLGGLALLAFATAGTLLALLLTWAFLEVENLNRQLASHNQRLERANLELALAARSAALGAVSAHLMHGLKNPLASLAQFVRNQNHPDTDPDPADWQDARAAAHRMQSLVEQTLEVLAEAADAPLYDVSTGEIADQTRDRVAPLAQQRQVELHLDNHTPELLPSRTANLVTLILVNLLENGVQATPPGGRVSLTTTRTRDRLLWRVEDQGPGFPTHLRNHLFLPCRSTRDDGTGLGLAISKQVADHLGATLELQDSPAGGCVFDLGLPLARAGTDDHPA